MAAQAAAAAAAQAHVAPVALPFASAHNSSVTIAGSSLATQSSLAIAQASGGGTMRTCAIEFGNCYHAKQDVQVVAHFKGYHVESGVCNLPPTPTIPGGVREACCFKRTNGVARGSVGVIVWTIKAHHTNNNSREQLDLALMWSVPYDYNWYQNWFAIKMATELTPGYNLYKQMYYDTEIGFQRAKAAAGAPISVMLNTVTATATMADAGQSIIKLEIGKQ